MKRILFGLAFLALSTAASAQVPQTSIILTDINNALTPEDLALLQAKLKNTLSVSVRSQEKSFSYRITFNTGLNQYNSEKLMGMDDLFGNAYAYTSITLISDDMYAVNNGSVISRARPTRAIISTYRLQPKFMDTLFHRHLLVERIYKLTLSIIGGMHGLHRTCGLMGEIKSAAEIDALPDTYCDTDAALLRGFGILK